MERLQFHSLLKDELSYEVSIRSETPSSTVDGMRKQLRELLQECPPEAILETDFSDESELDIVSGKLQDLSTCVDRYLSLKDRYSSCRSKALGIHLYHRLIRIQVDDDPAKALIKAELTSQLETLLSKVEGLGQSLGISGSVEHIQASGINPQHTSNKEIKVVCSGTQNVSKWNLKFNGLTDPRSFLERVDELKLAFGVSDASLFCSAAQLFSENALFWYRGIKDQVSSWKQLKDILLDEFDTPDYDYRLLGEIRSRTQGSDEPIHIYVAIMNCMFARLKTALSEEAKLEILLHNIRPTFSQQLALINIKSIAELKENCRKLEAAGQRAQLFVEPSKSCSNTLSSDFAYKGRSKQVNSVNVSANHSSNNSERVKFEAPSQSVSRKQNSNQQHFHAKSTHAQGSSNVPVCYHCGGTNHVFKFCKRKRITNSIKCFGCGKVGMKITDCDSCQSRQAADKQKLTSKSKNL